MKDIWARGTNKKTDKYVLSRELCGGEVVVLQDEALLDRDLFHEVIKVGNESAVAGNSLKGFVRNCTRGCGYG